jgi:hypothetical protein
VHIDPSLTGDATGLAVGCVSGFRRVVREDEEGNKYEEDAPLIWVDFILRILPPKGGEIFLGDVRNLVYQLAEHGFPISKVTMDSFQSAESVQNFKLKGYQSEVISVDATIQPYQMLKGTLYEGRISYYEYPILQEELSKLELDWERKKVDHPPSGSKDCADALCGLVWSLSQKYSKEGARTYGAPPMQGISEAPQQEEYVPVDSKHKKAGEILWPDEYEDQLFREMDEKGMEDWGNPDEMPPFLVG